MKQLRRAVGSLLRASWGIVDSLTDRPLLSDVALNLAKKEVIGHSTQNREIISYQLPAQTKPKQIILFAGATHGNEVGTIKLAYELLNWLAGNYTLYPNIAFHVIPCLNPDGYASAAQQPDYLGGGRIGRFNGRDVDLNRNFPVGSWQPTASWNHGENYSEATAVNAGTSAGSEPEIQALTAYMKKQNITAYAAFHSTARDVMGNDNPLSQRLAKTFAQVSGYRFIPPTDWHAEKYTGSAREWCDDHKIAYLEIEATRRWGSDWPSQREALVAVIKQLNETA